MQLDGIHPLPSNTPDAPQNVDFYARILGLRLAKKTVNQDDPTVYHLFYTDEHGAPGSDLTFFEYPTARRGAAGAGMVHRIRYRVPSSESLTYWEERLRSERVAVTRTETGSVRFADPEGLQFELVVDTSGNAPLAARSSEVDATHALLGFDGVDVLTVDPAMSEGVYRDVLGLVQTEPLVWESHGPTRSAAIRLETSDRRGRGGAGTVHHVAFSAQTNEIQAWQERVTSGGLFPTPVVDRFYFDSVYFREPSGVLIELATLDPGFTADEPFESLGESLSLPPRFEPLRDAITPQLTPLPDTRRWRQ